eukprot:754066-Hanusia_phi.AAC.1
MMLRKQVIEKEALSVMPSFLQARSNSASSLQCFGSPAAMQDMLGRRINSDAENHKRVCGGTKVWQGWRRGQ